MVSTTRHKTGKSASAVDTQAAGKLKGLIFHIIHGSFVDGYGIRTTVFLKGCPLRCLWCCNPEGQEALPEVKFTPNLCDGCGRCVDGRAIQAEKDKVKIDRPLYMSSGKRADVCFTGALDYFGKYYTVDEVFDIVKKDEQYYRASGGGVTIGGGEPTFQAAFTLALLRKCKENYIHAALDTCGYTRSPEGIRCLEEADLLLFDIKHMDPAEHLKCTGVPNDIILENIKRLNSIGKPMIIRIPLVPGYNDSAENIENTAVFLSRLKHVERVDLLAYHEYGAIKHLQLGREYPLHVQSPSAERMNEIKSTFERWGLTTQLGG